MGPGKDTVQQMVDGINASEELKNQLKNWEKIAGYKLEGEEGPFHVIYKADGSCELREGEPEKADFTFIATSELWEQIARAEKDAQQSFLAGEFKIEGDAMATMKLLPIIKKLQEMRK